jgi:RecA-family ATPase
MGAAGAPSVGRLRTRRLVAAKLPIEKLQLVAPKEENILEGLNDRDQHPARTWVPPRLDTWLAKQVGKKKYLVDYVDEKGEATGFLPRDSKMLVSGKPKIAMKSFFASGLAIVVASGKPYGPLVPCEDRPCPTLVFAAEGSSVGTKDRWNWLSNEMEIPLAGVPLIFDHRTAISLDDDEWFLAIRKLVLKERIEFIIFDPLVMYMSGDENKVHEVAAIMKRLGRLAKTDWDTTVMFVHHLNKGGGKDGTPDIDEEIRGSSAIAGFYDVHYAIRKTAADQKHQNVTRRSKDDEEALFTKLWDIDKNRGTARFTLIKVEDFDKSLGDTIESILARLPDGKTNFKLRELKAAWGANTDSNISILINANKLAQAGQDYVRKD